MTTTAAEPSPLLKEIFNRERLQHFADELCGIEPSFDPQRFIALASRDLENLSIMQRLRQVAETFHHTLPGDYRHKLSVLRELAPRINHGFASIALPEYVALYGRTDRQVSLQALHFFTRFGSSEFAIRPFLQDDLEATLEVMQDWTVDENDHVRRLASEGCRPRLPWSFQLKKLIENPDPVWPILDRLRSDPSLYVRKSVANHLNDITKDHPDWVLEKVGAWPADNTHTKWIIRQALRTLVKKGHPAALAQLGATQAAKVEIETFAVTPAAVILGQTVELKAVIRSTSATDQTLVVDYAIHYVKKSGESSAKVFKWKEVVLAPNHALSLSIRRPIRNFTTRVHYPGTHRVDLLVNGSAVASTQFELTV